MSKASDSLFQFVLGSIPNVSGQLRLSSIADALIEPTAAYDLTFDSDARAIVVDFRDPYVIAQNLAGDSCRLASAAFQTMTLVESQLQERDSVPWALVKLYYSAFYAGNALLRLFGESCSFFDRSHAQRIIDISDALSRERPFRVEAGLYHCAVSENRMALRCRRIRAGAGGAHESFWQVFGEFVQRSGEMILRSDLPGNDSQEVYAQLERLRDTLRRGVSFSWLSLVRNDLQYRHQFGVWFPFSMKKRERQSLGRIVQKWKDDPMRLMLGADQNGILGEFISACCFIVSLCKAVLSCISDRSPAGRRCFVNLGPMAFLRDVRA